MPTTCRTVNQHTLLTTLPALSFTAYGGELGLYAPQEKPDGHYLSNEGASAGRVARKPTMQRAAPVLQLVPQATGKPRSKPLIPPRLGQAIDVQCVVALQRPQLLQLRHGVVARGGAAGLRFRVYLREERLSVAARKRRTIWHLQSQHRPATRPVHHAQKQ